MSVVVGAATIFALKRKICPRLREAWEGGMRNEELFYRSLKGIGLKGIWIIAKKCVENIIG